MIEWVFVFTYTWIALMCYKNTVSLTVLQCSEGTFHHVQAHVHGFFTHESVSLMCHFVQCPIEPLNRLTLVQWFSSQWFSSQ